MVVDPFRELGLQRTFDLDRGALQAAFLRRSAAIHPDRVAGAVEQAQAMREIATLNHAHATLADDEQRANALLSLLGGPASDQDKSLPSGFLAQMMEVREEMESALASGDAGERARLEAWANDRRDQHIATVRTLFETASQMSGAAADPLIAIRRELNAWRYIERMIEQLERS